MTDIAGLMQQAKKMQEQMQKAQERTSEAGVHRRGWSRSGKSHDEW